MHGGRATVVVAVAILAACSTGPNADGWWDPAVHAVDGYWVTQESTCPEDDVFCQTAARFAEATFHETQPDAVVIKTWIADYPRMHGRNENEVSFVYAGLVTPRFVILDLEGGTRRLITLSCGAFGGGGEFSCQRASYDLFKVGHREPPQQ